MIIKKYKCPVVVMVVWNKTIMERPIMVIVMKNQLTWKVSGSYFVYKIICKYYIPREGENVIE